MSQPDSRDTESRVVTVSFDAPVRDLRALRLNVQCLENMDGELVPCAGPLMEALNAAIPERANRV